MRYMIDTHVLLWWLADDSQLSNKVRSIIRSEPVWVSTAAIWEIVIKKRIGKLEIPDDLQKQLRKNGFNLIDIKLDHVMTLESLEDIHNDPFDRIQIAQSKSENLTFITNDRRILEYSGVGLIEA